jgi:hypothetical protein
MRTLAHPLKNLVSCATARYKRLLLPPLYALKPCENRIIGYAETGPLPSLRFPSNRILRPAAGPRQNVGLVSVVL